MGHWSSLTGFRPILIHNLKIKKKFKNKKNVITKFHKLWYSILFGCLQNGKWILLFFLKGEGRGKIRRHDFWRLLLLLLYKIPDWTSTGTNSTGTLGSYLKWTWTPATQGGWYLSPSTAKWNTDPCWVCGVPWFDQKSKSLPHFLTHKFWQKVPTKGRRKERTETAIDLTAKRRRLHQPQPFYKKPLSQKLT